MIAIVSPRRSAVTSRQFGGSGQSFEALFCRHAWLICALLGEQPVHGEAAVPFAPAAADLDHRRSTRGYVTQRDVILGHSGPPVARVVGHDIDPSPIKTQSSVKPKHHDGALAEISRGKLVDTPNRRPNRALRDADRKSATDLFVDDH